MLFSCLEEDIDGNLILYGEVIGVETRTVLYIVGVVVRLLPFVGPLFHLGIFV